jgi:HSP20 family molecular chaperone IbpA
MAETQSADPPEGGQVAGTSDATAAKSAAAADVEVTRRPDVLEPSSWVSDWVEDWTRMFGRRWPKTPWWTPIGMRAEAIKVEQHTDADQLVIRAELPGIDPDRDVDVSVVNDRLTISAHREQREESKTDRGFRSEFHYGAFRRTVPLPPGATADDVNASYTDGILEVRVPIDRTRAATARIPVERKK